MRRLKKVEVLEKELIFCFEDNDSSKDDIFHAAQLEKGISSKDAATRLIWLAASIQNDTALRPVTSSREQTIDEMQQCIDRAAEFMQDIFLQMPKLVVQDYANLNELAMLLSKLKSKE